MALKRITAPTVLPVSLAEAKAHLRVDTTDDDTLITALVWAATEAAEQHTGRALTPQAWQLTLDEFPDALELTRLPAVSVTSITYADTDGVDQTLAGSAYSLDTADDFGFAYIVPAYDTTWPDTRDQINAVTVVYQAGYADAASVPESIKAWIKLQVGAMFENREAEVVGSGSAISLGYADRLLDRFKVYSL